MSYISRSEIFQIMVSLFKSYHLFTRKIEAIQQTPVSAATTTAATSDNTNANSNSNSNSSDGPPAYTTVVTGIAVDALKMLEWVL